MSTILKRLPTAILFLLLAACKIETPTRLTPEPTPVITPPYPSELLAVNNVEKIVELAALRVDRNSPVIAIAFTPDGQQLLAVYGDGTLRRWQVSNGNLQAAWDVGPVKMSLLSFDNSARLIAIGSEDINGVKLWDTGTGALLLELSANYEDSISAVALSPDGNWVFGGWPGAYRFWDASSGHFVKAGGGSVEIDSDLDMPQTPAIATFDAAGEWVVVGYEHGVIEADVWEKTSKRFQWTYKQPNSLTSYTPLALALDPTRGWLAAVIGDSLQVWDVSVYPLPSRQTHADIGTGQEASLAFSPNGKLLAVGTGEGWQLYSVPKFDQLVSEPGRATCAVTFSPDCRLFAWGDKDGVVHIWGVRIK